MSITKSSFLPFLRECLVDRRKKFSWLNIAFVEIMINFFVIERPPFKPSLWYEIVLFTLSQVIEITFVDLGCYCLERNIVLGCYYQHFLVFLSFKSIRFQHVDKHFLWNIFLLEVGYFFKILSVLPDKILELSSRQKFLIHVSFINLIKDSEKQSWLAFRNRGIFHHIPSIF